MRNPLELTVTDQITLEGRQKEILIAQTEAYFSFVARVFSR